MATLLPRNPVAKNGIYAPDIAAAIMGLRLDKIVSIKWSLKPSVGIVAKDIERLGLDIRSFREPLTKIVKLVMIPSIKKNFAEGGRPSWEPLAESTIIARKYSAWPILEVTGLLKKRATQFNIWSINLTTATVKALPSDVYYGAYHQSGAGGSGAGLADQLLAFQPGSAGANALIQKFIPAAVKDLEGRGILKPGMALTTELKTHIKNRAVGLLLEADEGGWVLPERPFIMWQDSDVPKMDAIFLEWMTERAIKSGRFRPS